MIIKKCDLCGNEQKEPCKISSAFSRDNIVLSCDDAIGNVISGLKSDNIISIIKQQAGDLRDKRKVTNICMKCCDEIRINLYKYYLDQTEQIVPALFDKRFQDQGEQS